MVCEELNGSLGAEIGAAVGTAETVNGEAVENDRTIGVKECLKGVGGGSCWEISLDKDEGAFGFGKFVEILFKYSMLVW